MPRERRRAEDAFARAEGAAADESDLAASPARVRGYVGPGSSGGAGRGGDAARGGRYRRDPRGVAGTTWVTGANEPGRHVFGLVAGRDFAADGVVEVASVRDGDEAPDGSGPVELARGRVDAVGHRVGEAEERGGRVVAGEHVADDGGGAVEVVRGLEQFGAHAELGRHGADRDLGGGVGGVAVRRREDGDGAVGGVGELG